MKTMKRERWKEDSATPSQIYATTLRGTEGSERRTSAMCLPGQMRRPNPYAWWPASENLVPMRLPSELMKRSGLKDVGSG